MAGCGRKNGRCGRCETPLDFEFTMAFQPIIDLTVGAPRGWEALVRGIQGESAFDILSRVTDRSLYKFDQACRVRAIELGHRLNARGVLSINFLPNAVYEPEACIQATLEVAEKVGWPPDRICFEITETEAVRDRRHLQNIVTAYKAMGFKTALDDFGAGYANLELLIDITPDVLKLDRHLISGIDSSTRRQIVVDSAVTMAQRLDIEIVAEGVETLAEARWLYRRGITLHQGYLYARPAVEQLPGCEASVIEQVWQEDSRRSVAV